MLRVRRLRVLLRCVCWRVTIIWAVSIRWSVIGRAVIRSREERDAKGQAEPDAKPEATAAKPAEVPATVPATSIGKTRCGYRR